MLSGAMGNLLSLLVGAGAIATGRSGIDILPMVIVAQRNFGQKLEDLLVRRNLVNEGVGAGRDLRRWVEYNRW